MATPIPDNETRLTAWAAAAAAGGRVARVRGEGVVARGVTTDSRAVRPGGAFVALRGETYDGHDYLEGAMERGAGLVVVERGRAPSLGAADVVEVDDTLVAWGAIARAHLRALRATGTRVLAITGSAGKTTTKELCAALLRTQRATLATAGNLNNRVGLPAMALAAASAHRFVVLEAGMSLRGEIEALAAITEPDVAVIVNVGVAHAGVGGSRGDVAREKGALFEALRNRSVAVANADDEACRGQLARTSARAVTFGRAADADVRLLARDPLPGGAGARLRIARRDAADLAVTLPLAGEAAAIDLCAALAAADAAAGAPLGEAAVTEALAGVVALAGRGARLELGGVTVLDDTYNANPGSVRAALVTLGEIAGTARRRLLVLGEMKELGDAEVAEHAALGDAIAAAGVAVAVGCGGLADVALVRAEERGVRVVRAPSTDAAGAAAVAEVRSGDVVLVKASRSVGAERVVRALARSLGGGPA